MASKRKQPAPAAAPPPRRRVPAGWLFRYGASATAGHIVFAAHWLPWLLAVLALGGGLGALAFWLARRDAPARQCPTCRSRPAEMSPARPPCTPVPRSHALDRPRRLPATQGRLITID